MSFPKKIAIAALFVFALVAAASIAQVFGSMGSAQACCGPTDRV